MPYEFWALSLQLSFYRHDFGQNSHVAASGRMEGKDGWASGWRAFLRLGSGPIPPIGVMGEWSSLTKMHLVLLLPNVVKA